MRESNIEKAVCDFARANGCLVLKLSGSNQKGQPDRLLLRYGAVLFIEFKAPTKQPTALQARWMRQLWDHQFTVACVDDVAQGKKLVRDTLL